MALNDVPLAGQTLLQTRNPINQNFANIESAFIVNHVDYGLGAQSGKHNFVEMPVQAAVPVTIAGETGIYCATGPDTGIPELFFKRENLDATNAGIPFTEALLAQTGWTYLPSGAIMQWGTTTIGAAFTAIPFPLEFNGLPVVNVTPIVAAPTNNIANILTGTTSTTGFTVGLRGGNGVFAAGDLFWMAMGF